jgi:hypothetical protein
VADEIIPASAESTTAEERIQLATPEETASLAQSRSGRFDFIDTYVRYADVVEAPPEAHEAVAIQMLAAVLNPRVQIRLGGLRIPLDLWVLLLSPSGLGRNTLVGLARPILEAARLEGIVLNATWGSKQAFYQNISEHPEGLLVWPQAAAVFSNLADPRFAGVKEWITDRYDNQTIPEPIRYRKTGRAADTPSIDFPRAPRLNILATSSFDWFTLNLKQEDTTGGFVPRWILSQARSPSRIVPIPRTPDTELIRPLGGYLSEASLLDGAADLSEVETLYGEWYVPARLRFLAQPNSELAMPFFNRLRAHVPKLAVVYQVSQSLTLNVSPQAMQRAIEMAHSCEQTIFSLLPTGLNQEGSAVDRIAERVRQAGPDGLSKSALTKAFQHVRKMDRENRLHTLQEAEVVLRFFRGTSGRKAEVLVHKDFAEEHVLQFPEDERV